MDLKDKITLGIAAWGAGLSSVLVIVRLAEWLRARPRLVTSYLFTTSRDNGHVIYLANASAVPAVIIGWRLSWGRRHRFRIREIENIATNDPDSGPFTVKGHDTATFGFAEADYFLMPSLKLADRRDIYLKLWIAGRKSPLWLKVYDGIDL